MREELSTLLRDRYPLIFPQRPAVPADPDAVPAPFLVRGFECEDGWFDLIDVLCGGLQRATEHGAPQVVAFQVKEKFGTLHFYADGADTRQRAMIEFAETMSGRLCEVCGCPGATTGRRWIVTRCSAHSLEG